ncbi:hypothetical protein DX933_10835 [Ornithinibacillus gellani]|uniref:hypothetical protein n=1 Tax=Ornithinibacillus gellani TaxID=2293253 RepID=UPI000F4634E3|nr:hypothetical protein [Ornithinibacillus gellani]TQS74438.1 hypothetical protein DX933_10835 [Ornithinibacillus gellani]
MVEDKDKSPDQADELRKLLDEVQQSANDEKESEQIKEETEPTYSREIDILNLPPRREVHGNNNSKARMTFNRPLFRLIIVLLLVIGFTAGLFYFYGDEILNILNQMN